MNALHRLKPALWPAQLVLATLLAAACAAPMAPVPSSTTAQGQQAVPPTPEPANATPVATAPTANLDGCVDHYDPTVNYFPEQTNLEYATGFKVEYFSNYKVVTVLKPWRDATETFEYVLVQCGTPAPQGYDDAQVITIPAQRIVTMSTTYLANLDQLGLVDRLVGVDEFKYANTPSVVKKIKAGELVEIGGLSNVNVETALNLNPDFVMAHGIGMPDYDAHPKLMEAGIKVVLNGDYTEDTPLGRSEWLKFVALFFNREAKAQSVFSNIVQEYQSVSKLAQSVTEKPTVLLSSMYQGTWWISGGRSYTAKLLSDAGANYIWADDQSVASMPMDFETVFDKASNAQFWLNPDNVMWNSIDDVLASDERYGDFAALQGGHLYNNNARANESGGNDYYESGIANPHLILKDMVKILHPDLLPDYQLVYYKQLK